MIDVIKFNTKFLTWCWNPIICILFLVASVFHIGLPVFPCLNVLPIKHLFVIFVLFFSASCVCCIVWLVYRFWVCPVRFGVRIILCDVLLRVRMYEENCVVCFSSVFYFIRFRYFFLFRLAVQCLYCISFLYIVWIVLTIVGS